MNKTKDDHHTPHHKRVPILTVRTTIVLLFLTGMLVLSRTNLSRPALEPTVDFGGVSLRLEYATSSVARQKGLGGRLAIPADYGMLFVFERPGLYGIWMKDMLAPIDIFWLDADGRVVSISERVTSSTYPNVFYPTAPAMYVLETTAGFASANGIATGTPLQLKKLPSVLK